VNSPHRARLSLLAKTVWFPALQSAKLLRYQNYFPDTVGLARCRWSTATHESLGIATLEAMYARNCCLLPDLGVLPRGGGTGFEKAL